MKCIFCDIFSSDITPFTIHRTEHAIAFLPLEMESYGHTIISPIQHFESIYDITPFALAETLALLRLVANHYKLTIGSTGCNILNASGKSAQQSVPHFHWHLLPRFNDDKIDAWPLLPKNDFNKNEFHEKYKFI